MTKIERVRKVIKWLIFSDIIENESDLAKKLSYTKSSLSQILNEKVPLSKIFLSKLISLDENINIVWIENEKGNMLLKNYSIPENNTYIVSEPKTEYNATEKSYIKLLEENLREKKEQLQACKSEVESLKKYQNYK